MDWGTEVWKSVGEYHESEDESQDEHVRYAITVAFLQTTIYGGSVRVPVSRPLHHLYAVPTKLPWFRGISELLGDIGRFEKIRELSLAGADQSFVMRWTCLSLVAIRPILAAKSSAQYFAKVTMEKFSREDDTGNDDDALEAARKIDETLKKASDCLIQLNEALPKQPSTEYPTEEVKEILRNHESQISELEQINIEADDRLKWADSLIFDMQDILDNSSHQITSQLPGILDEFDFDRRVPIPFSRLAELSRDPRQGDDEAYKELLKNLRNSSFSSWGGDEMQRQLLHLQDLRDGGGLGYTVELFFLALSRLLSTSSSKESHSALYTGTFRAITSDWSKYKDSLGTQNSFSISPRRVASSLKANTLLILSRSFWCYCATFLKDRQAHILTK
ncbi:hypothetical protein BGY98DRAFT_1182471 [Russula aff. rugulosa BPL654]|nr:hypothetical protein BGY98DRAFT_1182471 [Russula aff. rugulosa BPL654]